MASQLDSIAALPDQKAKIDRYRDVLNAMVATGSVADLQAFIEHGRCIPQCTSCRSCSDTLTCTRQCINKMLNQCGPYSRSALGHGAAGGQQAAADGVRAQHRAAAAGAAEGGRREVRFHNPRPQCVLEQLPSVHLETAAAARHEAHSCIAVDFQNNQMW